MRDFLRDAVRTSLKPLESLALHLGEPIPFPPIFIISMPRSGSTLLYLLAVRKFRLSYFSNFAMACPARERGRERPIRPIQPGQGRGTGTSVERNELKRDLAHAIDEHPFRPKTR